MQVKPAWVRDRYVCLRGSRRFPSTRFAPGNERFADWPNHSSHSNLTSLERRTARSSCPRDRHACVSLLSARLVAETPIRVGQRSGPSWRRGRREDAVCARPRLVDLGAECCSRPIRGFNCFQKALRQSLRRSSRPGKGLCDLGRFSWTCPVRQQEVIDLAGLRSGWYGIESARLFVYHKAGPSKRLAS